MLRQDQTSSLLDNNKMLFLFTTQMVNQATESVKSGRFSNIVAYHKSLDESKRVLAKLQPKYSSPAKPCHSSSSTFSLSAAEQPGGLDMGSIAAQSSVAAAAANSTAAAGAPPQLDKFACSSNNNNNSASSGNNVLINKSVKIESQQLTMNNGGYGAASGGGCFNGPTVQVIKRELSSSLDIKPPPPQMVNIMYGGGPPMMHGPHHHLHHVHDPSNLPIITDGAGSLSGGDPLEKMARLTQEALPFEPPLKQPKLDFSSSDSKPCSISSSSAAVNSNNNNQSSNSATGPNNSVGGGNAKLSDDLLTPSQRQHRQMGLQKLESYKKDFESTFSKQQQNMVVPQMPYLPPGMVPAMNPEAMKFMDPCSVGPPPMPIHQPGPPSIDLQVQQQQQKWRQDQSSVDVSLDKSGSSAAKGQMPQPSGASPLTPTGVTSSGNGRSTGGNVPTMMVAGKPAVMVHPNMNAKANRGSRAQQQQSSTTASSIAGTTTAASSDKYFPMLSANGPPPPNVTFVDPGFDPYAVPLGDVGGPQGQPYHHQAMHPGGPHPMGPNLQPPRAVRPCFIVQQPLRGCPPAGATVVYGHAPSRPGPMAPNNGGGGGQPPPSNVNLNMNIQINAGGGGDPNVSMGSNGHHPMGPPQLTQQQCYPQEFMPSGPIEDEDNFGQYDTMYAPGPPNVNIALAGMYPPSSNNTTYFCGPGANIMVEQQQDPSVGGPPGLAVQMHSGMAGGPRMTAHAHGPPHQQQHANFMGPITVVPAPMMGKGAGPSQQHGSMEGHSPMVNNTFVNATMQIQQVNIQNVGPPFPHGNIVGMQHSQPVPAGAPFVITTGYQNHQVPPPRQQAMYRQTVPCGPQLRPGSAAFLQQQQQQFSAQQQQQGPPKINPENGPRLLAPDFQQLQQHPGAAGMMMSSTSSTPPSPHQTSLTFLNPTMGGNLTPNPNYEDFQQQLYSTTRLSRQSADSTPNFT